MRLHIGVDFDNTIVRYDEVFGELARERGLVPASFAGGKTALRDFLRAREGGEREWTALQARAYGPSLRRAVPFAGVVEFFSTCRARGVPLAIVSHKSEFAVAEPSGVNLRDAARDWLREHGLASEAPGGTPAYFESSRAEKIARIKSVGCTHFIDDLEEVFRDPAFPSDVRRVLFVPEASRTPAGSFEIARSWDAIATAVLA